MNDLPTLLNENCSFEINGAAVDLCSLKYETDEPLTGQDKKDSYVGKSLHTIFIELKLPIQNKPEAVYNHAQTIFRSIKSQKYSSLINEVYNIILEQSNEFYPKEQIESLIQKYYFEKLKMNVSDKLLMKTPDEAEIEEITKYVISNIKKVDDNQGLLEKILTLQDQVSKLLKTPKIDDDTTNSDSDYESIIKQIEELKKNKSSKQDVETIENSLNQLKETYEKRIKKLEEDNEVLVEYFTSIEDLRQSGKIKKGGK
ncbi:Uncharacterised protein [Candidatus Tiddalikarchaeum anstoanum]|nr:Uncharacterised protein [Candidatus Tiddalikarchaeum anstoanum]